MLHKNQVAVACMALLYKNFVTVGRQVHDNGNDIPGSSI